MGDRGPVTVLLALGAAELALTGRAESYTSMAALLLYVGAYQVCCLRRRVQGSGFGLAFGRLEGG